MAYNVTKMAVNQGTVSMGRSLNSSSFYDAMPDNGVRCGTEQLDSLFESDSDVMVPRGENLFLDDMNSISSSSEDHSSILSASDRVTEFAILVASSLASDVEGATISRLSAHVRSDWDIDVENEALSLGFSNFMDFLDSDVAKQYIEMRKVEKNDFYYGTVCKRENEHILVRVREDMLTENARLEKQKRRKLMELKKPENQKLFIEGKRRIIEVLKELKAYNHPISYQDVRNLYEKKFGSSLNEKEHSKFFLNKSALKNFRRCFFKEVQIIETNPITLLLLSKDVMISDEFSEEDRFCAANLQKIDLSDLNALPRMRGTGGADQDASFGMIRDIDDELLLKSQLNMEVNKTKGTTMFWGDENDSYSSGEDAVVGTSINSNNFGSFTKKAVLNSTNVKKNVNSERFTSAYGGKYTDDEESEESDSEEILSQKSKFENNQKKPKVKSSSLTFGLSFKNTEVEPKTASSIMSNFPSEENDSSLAKDVCSLQVKAGSGRRSKVANDFSNYDTNFVSLKTKEGSSMNQRYGKFSSSKQFRDSPMSSSKNSIRQSWQDRKENHLDSRIIQEYHNQPLPTRSCYSVTPTRSSSGDLNNYSSSGFQRESFSCSAHDDKRMICKDRFRAQCNGSFANGDTGQLVHSECHSDCSHRNDASKLTPVSSVRRMTVSDDLRSDLATVIKVAVDRSPEKLILLSSLHEVVGRLYGRTFNPETENGMSYRDLILQYCRDVLDIVRLPDGRDLVVWKK